MTLSASRLISGALVASTLFFKHALGQALPPITTTITTTSAAQSSTSSVIPSGPTADVVPTEPNAPAGTMTGGSSSPNWTLIGIIAGSVVGVILLIVLFIIVKRGLNKKKRRNQLPLGMSFNAAPVASKTSTPASTKSTLPPPPSAYHPSSSAKSRDNLIGASPAVQTYSYTSSMPAASMYAESNPAPYAASYESYYNQQAYMQQPSSYGATQMPAAGGYYVTHEGMQYYVPPQGDQLGAGGDVQYYEQPNNAQQH